jgi:hypothetical protein
MLCYLTFLLFLQLAEREITAATCAGTLLQAKATTADALLEEVTTIADVAVMECSEDQNAEEDEEALRLGDRASKMMTAILEGEQLSPVVSTLLRFKSTQVNEGKAEAFSNMQTGILRKLLRLKRGGLESDVDLPSYYMLGADIFKTVTEVGIGHTSIKLGIFNPSDDGCNFTASIASMMPRSLPGGSAIFHMVDQETASIVELKALEAFQKLEANTGIPVLPLLRPVDSRGRSQFWERPMTFLNALVLFDNLPSAQPIMSTAGSSSLPTATVQCRRS